MEHRPLILENGRLRELPATGRIPLQHAPVYVERVLEWVQTTPNRFQRTMDTGVVDYVLPSVPNGAIEVQINGVGVNYTLTGVNLHITEYSAGSIDNTDELTVYFYGAALAGANTIHELVVSGDEVVMTEAS